MPESKTAFIVSENVTSFNGISQSHHGNSAKRRDKKVVICARKTAGIFTENKFSTAVNTLKDCRTYAG